MRNYSKAEEEEILKHISLVTPLIVFIIAIVFLGIGYFLKSDATVSIPNAKTTSGTLYWERNKVRSRAGSLDPENIYYDVYADYTVNGKHYYQFLYQTRASYVKSENGSFYANTSNKKNVTIYYNPDNPTQIIVPSENSWSGIFIFVGYAFIAMSVLILIIAILKEKNKGTPYEGRELHQVSQKLGETYDSASTIYGYFKKGVFFVVGILIMLFGFSLVNGASHFRKNAVETTATVSRINKHEERDMRDNKKYLQTDVYVRYRVGGKAYENKLDKYDSSIKEGDKVTVYYNASNPSEMNSSKSNGVGVIVIIVGAIFTISGILADGRALGLGTTKFKR